GRSIASARSGWPWRGDVRPRAFLFRLDSPSASRGRSSWSISATFMIVAAAVVLGLLLYYAQYSGSVQWGLGLVFLGVIAFLPRPCAARSGTSVSRNSSTSAWATWKSASGGSCKPAREAGSLANSVRSSRGWRHGDERRFRRGGGRIHPRCRRAGDRRQAPGAR